MTASCVRPDIVTLLLAMLVIVASGWVLLPFPRRPRGWAVASVVLASVRPARAGLWLRVHHGSIAGEPGVGRP